MNMCLRNWTCFTQLVTQTNVIYSEKPSSAYLCTLVWRRPENGYFC